MRRSAFSQTVIRGYTYIHKWIIDKNPVAFITHDQNIPLWFMHYITSTLVANTYIMRVNDLL